MYIGYYMDNNCTCDTLKKYYYALKCNETLNGNFQTFDTTTCLNIINIYATQCSYDTHRIIIKHPETKN